MCFREAKPDNLEVAESSGLKSEVSESVADAKFAVVKGRVHTSADEVCDAMKKFLSTHVPKAGIPMISPGR